jgi:uncharacterized membrane protein
MAGKTGKKIRTNIITGTLILLPMVTTIYVFYKLFVLIDSILPNFFHVIVPFIPADWFPGVGAVVIILVTILTGMLARNYFGRMIIATGNRMIANIPMINKVYIAVQQVLDAVIRSDKKVFQRTVLVEFPSPGSWAIGFVTSDRCGEIQRKTSPEVISVFVATTPNPTSGFLIYVKRSKIIDLDMAVETGIKLIMSAGVVNPDTLKRTDRLYQFQSQSGEMNWMKVFKPGRTEREPDPRD